MTDSRQRILDRIRGSLAANRELLSSQAAMYPPPHSSGPFVASDQDLVEQFRSELSALHAHVHVCDRHAALDRILAIIESAGATSVMAWAANELPLHGVYEQLNERGIDITPAHARGDDRHARYSEMEPLTVGITGVHVAVSESGSMIMINGPGRGRLISLLPPVHIALLPAERIVRTLPEAFAQLQSEHGEATFRDHANVVIATGPSRTADIELSLTLGVHGPRDVHAIVMR